MIFRRIRAWWTGACCRCERHWGEHWEDCLYRPVYLCRRCVDERLSGASKGPDPSRHTWRP